MVALHLSKMDIGVRFPFPALIFYMRYDMETFLKSLVVGLMLFGLTLLIMRLIIILICFKL